MEVGMNGWSEAVPWRGVLALVALGFVLGWIMRGEGTAHADVYNGPAASDVKWADTHSQMRVILGYRDDGVVVWRRL